MTVDAIANRLDTVRELLGRDDLSAWARKYWTAVEGHLVRRWQIVTKEYL